MTKTTVEINDTLQELRKEYIAELQYRKDTNNPNYQSPLSLRTPSEAADRMFEAIRTGWSKADWLKHNPALRVAAKSVGITKSSQLRELIKGKEAA